MEEKTDAEIIEEVKSLSEYPMEEKTDMEIAMDVRGEAKVIKDSMKGKVNKKDMPEWRRVSEIVRGTPNKPKIRSLYPTKWTRDMGYTLFHDLWQYIQIEPMYSLSELYFEFNLTASTINNLLKRFPEFKTIYQSIKECVERHIRAGMRLGAIPIKVGNTNLRHNHGYNTESVVDSNIQSVNIKMPKGLDELLNKEPGDGVNDDHLDTDGE